jgi:hypothetical protein
MSRALVPHVAELIIERAFARPVGECGLQVTGRLDKPARRNYLNVMNIIRRTPDIYPDTDTRLRQMADERGCSASGFRR